MPGMSADQMEVLTPDAMASSSDGLDVMDIAFNGQTEAPMDINPADAALGSAVDSSIDQGAIPSADS
jgi:hypothetical protein